MERLFTGVRRYHLLPSAWLKYMPPRLPSRGLVSGTQREPLSEKLPRHATSEVDVHVLPSQDVSPTLTIFQFIRAGRPSIVQRQLPPHHPETVLARDGTVEARSAALMRIAVSLGCMMAAPVVGGLERSLARDGAVVVTQMGEGGGECRQARQALSSRIGCAVQDDDGERIRWLIGERSGWWDALQTRVVQPASP